MLNIDIQNIINTLSLEFNTIIQQKKYDIEHVVVANERYFLENHLPANSIGVVFSLGSGLADLNEAVLPFDLTVISRDEKMDLTQELLFDFILTYTNTALNGYYQRYSTPSIDNEFVEYGSEVRTSWQVSGTIKFIADNSAILSLEWLNEDREWETIQVLESDCSINNEPSPQPMSDSYGETITINGNNTFAFGFSTYATKTGFYSKILADQINLGTKNNRYDMRVDFGNGVIYNVGMVVVSVQIKQPLGENSTVAITMAR